MDLQATLAKAAMEAELLAQALADKDARILALEKQVLEGGGHVPLGPPPPMDVYASLDELQERGWPRWPDTDETKIRLNDAWMRSKLTGGAWPPPRNVIIAQIGARNYVEVRPFAGAAPDYSQICNFRVVDVTSKIRCAAVQPGDGSFEDDPTDMAFLCRNYIGGLNTPLSTWPEEFQPYAKILAEARPDLAGEWEYNRRPGID